MVLLFQDVGSLSSSHEQPDSDSLVSVGVTLLFTSFSPMSALQVEFKDLIFMPCSALELGKYEHFTRCSASSDATSPL